jgi:type IV pilus assembly protein PilC
MLEPIMIVFMGATIGFIIIAMYLPIFQMGQMVG